MKDESAMLEQHILNIMPKVRTAPLLLQSRILKIAIAYLLKSEDVNQAVNICEDLYKNLKIDIGELKKSEGENQKDDAHELLSYFSEELEIGYALRSEAEVVHLVRKNLADISHRLQQIITDDFDESADLIQLVENLETIFEQNRQAMKQAAQSAFTRLLESLDPCSVEKLLDHSNINNEREKKAAMFDLLQEKHEQLSAYNESGMMVRDFRVVYKKQLNNGDRQR